ncbi:unnamed protein product [Brachionus calyciflorus]|uniref:ribonuclease Z n=1 Tax=Brachionus calyciflorus TaxID=104777 RepID=A0A813MY80_9BILA|nr:unnamed protein product [Brachionus calyciflorus]
MIKLFKILTRKNNLSLNLINKFTYSKNSYKSYDNMFKGADRSTRLQILSNGYQNSPKSCILIFDSNRYLINCGEGTLRTIVSSNCKPSKINNIFLTRFDWKCTGGLNGMSKELENLQNTVTLHSNFNFNFSSKNSIKKYFFERDFKIVQHDYSKADYSDPNVNIKKIDMGNTYCSYFINIKQSEPNLVMEKFSKFNVKPGRWIRDLKQGIEYNQNGIIIKPSDVLDYSECAEKKILVLDCPNTEALDIIRNDALINQEDMVMILHVADSQVLNSPDYLDWVKNYINKNCIHIFQDEAFPNIDLLKVYEMQAQLNLIDRDMFKLLPLQLESFRQVQDEFDRKEKEIKKEMKVIHAKSNMIFNLKPNLMLNLDHVKEIDNQAAQRKILEYYEGEKRYLIDGIDAEEKKILENFKTKISNFDPNNFKQAQNSDISYPNILFLGTASSLPATTRNLTGIFVRINPNVNIVLDCGEGTTWQINKYFNDETEFLNELIKIKLVYVSHFHLDHFNGLYSLIQNRVDAFKKLNRPYEKLNILHTRYLTPFLNGNYLIFKNNKFSSYVNTILNDSFLEKNYKNYLLDFKSFGLKSIKTILVKHINQSYAISLDILRPDGQNHFKLVYSGDCRPTEELVDFGKNCDLLIHECTFDDAYKDEAIRKRHSTIGEALDISHRMNAKSTIMTHFSLRYGKLTKIDDINRDNVGMAFDFMSVSENNFKDLNAILKDVKVAFKEHVDVIEQKRVKKLKL